MPKIAVNFYYYWFVFYIKIYDIAGRCVKSVINESRNSGAQKVLLNTEDIQNGIYFYTITGDRFTETKKFVVSK